MSLNAQQRTRILKLRARGLSLAAIAQILKCGKTTIHRALSGMPKPPITNKGGRPRKFPEHFHAVLAGFFERGTLKTCFDAQKYVQKTF